MDGSLLRHEIHIEVQNEPKILEVKLADFRDENEKSKGWLLLIEDRTEIKHLEMSLQQKEKLAAVGQLAAGIAHEIRNPLASISGSIQMMTASSDTNEENRKLMKIVDKEIDRLNGLISEFLNYVRPEDQVRDEVDVNQVLNECLEMVKFDQKLRQDIELKLNLKSASMILGHRDKLKQAFLNFIVNAYQAMGKTESPLFEVQTQDERGQVVVVFKDNGSGIKKENVNRIFEPFHTTKPSGTGLGLAITHKILEAHKAKIFVESEEKIGTQFLIEFPSVRGNFIEFNPDRKRA
jgi:two-component system, NtrC family, sensor histidine kinase PilS